MSRLEEAIDELIRAAAGRPFVLVIDKAHGDAPVTSMVRTTSPNQAPYVTLGLLLEAQARIAGEISASASLPPAPGP